MAEGVTAMNLLIFLLYLEGHKNAFFFFFAFAIQANGNAKIVFVFGSVHQYTVEVHLRLQDTIKLIWLLPLQVQE